LPSIINGLIYNVGVVINSHAMWLMKEHITHETTQRRGWLIVSPK